MDPLNVVDLPALQTLEQRLEDSGVSEATLRRVLGPLRTLTVLEDAAVRFASGDDQGRADLRLVLSTLGAQHPEAGGGAAWFGGMVADEIVTDVSTEELLQAGPPPPPDTLVDLSAAASLGLLCSTLPAPHLEASRQGQLRAYLVASVAWLVYGAGLAEVLHLALRENVGDGAFATAVASIDSWGTQGTLASVVNLLATHGAESQRQRSIRALFRLMARVALGHPDDAAAFWHIAGDALEVVPAAEVACAGQTMRILGGVQLLDRNDIPDHDGSMPPEHPDVAVLFAQQGPPVREHRLAAAGPDLVVAVPHGLSGWVALDLDADSQQAWPDALCSWVNRSWGWPQLHTLWNKVVRAVVTLPPRRVPELASNRLFIGRPQLELTVQPAVVENGETVTVRWAVHGPATWSLAVDPGGFQGQLPTGEHQLVLTDADVTAVLRAQNACGAAELTQQARVRRRLVAVALERTLQGVQLQVTASPLPAWLVVSSADRELWRAPMDQATQVVALDAGDGEVLDVSLFAPGDKAPDDAQVVKVDLAALPSPAVRLWVVVRPAVLDTPETVQQPQQAPVHRAHRATVARRLGVEVIEPLGPADGLRLLSTPVGLGDVRRMLARLDALALATPGLEHAVWAAVLPELPGTDPMLETRSGMGCALTVVVSESRLAELDTLRVTLRPPTRVLRLAGTLQHDAEVELTDTRVERRPLPPDGADDTLLDVVLLDAEDTELAVHPLQVHSTARPVTFTALVPMPLDIHSAEVRLAEVDLSALRASPSARLALAGLTRRRPIATLMEQLSTDPIARLTARGDGPLFAPLSNTVVPMHHRHALPSLTSIAGRLHWRVRGVTTVRASQRIQLSADGELWWGTASIDAELRTHALPVTLPPLPDDSGQIALRIEASDGWTAAASSSVSVLSDGLPQVRVHTSEEGRRFWVEVGAGTEFLRWELRETADHQMLLAALERGDGRSGPHWSSLLAAPTLHIVAALSTGGTLGHVEHLWTVVEQALGAGQTDVLVHAVLDGVTGPSREHHALLAATEDRLRRQAERHQARARLATVVGRRTLGLAEGAQEPGLLERATALWLGTEEPEPVETSELVKRAVGGLTRATPALLQLGGQPAGLDALQQALAESIVEVHPADLPACVLKTPVTFRPEDALLVLLLGDASRQLHQGLQVGTRGTPVAVALTEVAPGLPPRTLLAPPAATPLGAWPAIQLPPAATGVLEALVDGPVSEHRVRLPLTPKEVRFGIVAS